jgi:hypothetical protein
MTSEGNYKFFDDWISVLTVSDWLWYPEPSGPFAKSKLRAALREYKQVSSAYDLVRRSKARVRSAPNEVEEAIRRAHEQLIGAVLPLANSKPLLVQLDGWLGSFCGLRVLRPWTRIWYFAVAKAYQRWRFHLIDGYVRSKEREILMRPSRFLQMHADKLEDSFTDALTENSVSPLRRLEAVWCDYHTALTAALKLLDALREWRGFYTEQVPFPLWPAIHNLRLTPFQVAEVTRLVDNWY